VRKYFRRLGIDRTFDPPRLTAEITPGETYSLPNPTPTGRTYNPVPMMGIVAAARTITVELWELMPAPKRRTS
jgi:hypothetical protein